MKNKTATFSKIINTFFLSATIVTAFSAFALAQNVVSLQNSDCIKCHKAESASIEKNGGLHKTAVGCLDCHIEHPPLGTETIPQCSMCHAGKPHYELENCLSCHSDPHQPLALQLDDNITAACLTCHPEQGQELQDYPSKHTEVACTFCHTTHGEIPDCSLCHEPHTQGQTTTDCLGCHPVHKPLVIHYADETPRSYCTPCHEGVGDLMNQTETAHKTFTCAFCHKEVHGFIPQCETCHGKPHSASVHEKMPNCLDCHLDAHNLVK
ncbi:MAG: hypothetical protein AVO38_06500 [delta proteobacterium ML8_D]|jgi:hypothetical protein|nr:MAG: hypothetical protein AVO38_06500 [delta proteobacterium ML8_D]